MSGPIVFLVVQMFLLGITSGFQGLFGVQEPGVQGPGVQAPGVQAPGVQEPGVQGQTTQGPGCPVACTPCKNITEGKYTGSWNLKADMDQVCLSSCLYERNSDGKLMCFCDPGSIEYEVCPNVPTDAPTEAASTEAGFASCGDADPAYSIPCCPSYTEGFMIAEESQTWTDQNSNSDCVNACKAKYPDSIGVSVSLPKSNGRVTCLCHLGNPNTVSVFDDDTQQTCMF